LKAGVFGGTFDPIHLGHLRTAEEIGQQLTLEKVYLIPSASPPHKTGDPVTSFEDRMSMVRLAVRGASRLEVLDLEGRRPGLSYSIETLRELHSAFARPHTEFFFFLGMDAFLEINTWKEYKALFQYAHFVVIQRPGFHLDDLGSVIADLGLGFKETANPDVYRAPSGKTLIRMKPTLMDISSTRLRQMVSHGQSIRFLVPESVHDYIIEKGLYRLHALPR
jgi:nicotinate-nucleotide adenylyltransferase